MVYTGNKYEWITIKNEPIARGGNSRIYKVKRKKVKTCCALKLFTCTNSEQNRLERFRMEIEIVQELSLTSIEGIIHIIDHNKHESEPFYVMPYYVNGTYRDKYFSQKNTPKEPKIILSDFLRVLQIVKDLHSTNLAIRDIKPQNILVDENGYPVLSDFGLSLWTFLEDSKRLTLSGEKIGSQGYMPPEWVEKYPEIDHLPGDIWSLGRTLWAMFSGKNPPPNFETLGGEGTHLNQFIGREIANLIQSIVTATTAQDPKKRPNIVELIDLTKDVVSYIEENEETKKLKKSDFNQFLKKFKTQVVNSQPMIDANRLNSEINVKLRELNDTIEMLQGELKNYENELNHTNNEIGSFRILVNKSDFTVRVKNIKISKNENWKKTVTLRYDPNKKAEEFLGMNYVMLSFQMGLTQDKSFFWSVYSRDQTTHRELLQDEITTKSISNLVRKKVGQLDKFIKDFFLDWIMENFKA